MDNELIQQWVDKLAGLPVYTENEISKWASTVPIIPVNELSLGVIALYDDIALDNAIVNILSGREKEKEVATIASVMQKNYSSKTMKRKETSKNFDLPMDSSVVDITTSAMTPPPIDWVDISLLNPIASSSDFIHYLDLNDYLHCEHKEDDGKVYIKSLDSIPVSHKISEAIALFNRTQKKRDFDISKYRIEDANDLALNPTLQSLGFKVFDYSSMQWLLSNGKLDYIISKPELSKDMIEVETMEGDILYFDTIDKLVEKIVADSNSLSVSVNFSIPISEISKKYEVDPKIINEIFEDIKGNLENCTNDNWREYMENRMMKEYQIPVSSAGLLSQEVISIIQGNKEMQNEKEEEINFRPEDTTEIEEEEQYEIQLPIKLGRKRIGFSYINFKDMWSPEVKTKWTPPAGLFTKSAEEIVKVLKEQSEDEATAMRRLNFYINRAGKNLSEERRDELEKAKELLKGMNFSSDDKVWIRWRELKDMYDESKDEKEKKELDEEAIKLTGIGLYDPMGDWNGMNFNKLSDLAIDIAEKAREAGVPNSLAANIENGSAFTSTKLDDTSEEGIKDWLNRYMEKEGINEVARKEILDYYNPVSNFSDLKYPTRTRKQYDLENPRFSYSSYYWR